MQLLRCNQLVLDPLPVDVNLERVDRLVDHEALQLHGLPQQVPVAQLCQRLPLHQLKVRVVEQA